MEDVPLEARLKVVASLVTLAGSLVIALGIATILLAAFIYCCYERIKRGDTNTILSWFFEDQDRGPLLATRAGPRVKASNSGDINTYGTIMGPSGSGNNSSMVLNGMGPHGSVISNCGTEPKGSGPKNRKPINNNHTSCMVPCSSMASSSSRCSCAPSSSSVGSRSHDFNRYPPSQIPLPVKCISTHVPRLGNDTFDASSRVTSIQREVRSRTNEASSAEVPFVYIPPLPDGLSHLTMSFPKVKNFAEDRPKSVPPGVPFPSENSKTTPFQRWFTVKRELAPCRSTDTVDANTKSSWTVNSDANAAGLTTRTPALGINIEDLKARVNTVCQMIIASQRLQKRKLIYADPNDIRNHITR
ncbi:uncharacterized protein [Cherax quadricarinatus]|uniref:uncharacterized protein n=1 Tax=Cherax quadricarinatus TaxID=27406 RepID=UPI0023795E1E|nr:uncharacterized protein LOC128701128 [Cherax quadricarinatus]